MSDHRKTLKKDNKAFKSKHATKGSIKAKNKGKGERVSIKSNAGKGSSKADRRNAAKLHQKKKREEVLANARLFTGSSAPPKIVAIVPLCPDVESVDVVSALHNALELTGDALDSRPVTLSVERFRQKLQLLPLTRRMIDVLDAVRVADFVVFVMSAAVEVDDVGTRLLTAIKAQGVPNVIGVVQHLEYDQMKVQLDVRKSLLSYLEGHFPGAGAKVFSLSGPSETITFLRNITALRPKPMVWRDRHSYIVADHVEFEEGDNDAEDAGVLKVTGYIRGADLSANRLIHVQNYGDFQVKCITDVIKTRNGMEVDATILHSPNPELQDSLVSELTPDPMEGEQTWPTEEELAEADARVAAMKEAARSKKRTVRVPKGTSAYQAAWIVDDEDEDRGEDENDSEDRSEDEAMEEAGEDDGAVPHGEEEVEWEDEEYEEIELEGGKDEFDDDFNVDDDERQYNEYLAEKKKAAKDDFEFPDEVDTPRDVPARHRFARFRGLKSLRTSTWDPYENLPIDYARIFQFENFRRTRDRILKETEEGVNAGTRVVVHIGNVPKAVMDSYDQSRIFVIFSLLPHEHKTSLSTFIAHRIDPLSTSLAPAPIIKSKDPILIQYGFRRYKIKPLYSTDTRGGTNNVHRFERFFHHSRNVIGSFFGPVCFSNEPALLFREPTASKSSEMVDDDNAVAPAAEDAAPVLFAVGNVLPPSPHRIIAKRVLLTGHPFKINKRSAVIRYMFFNPLDVNYFKPIQLHTKLGRIGHIKESLGTHGYMKCVFDEQLKAQDTVMLSLYKRVFPKWGTELWKID
ncbi:hypothetical protein HK101_006525 [Irineochytrium annulatum]|nr:hypothetical protein HK101_006525 [Irineochytrium annulatum]